MNHKEHKGTSSLKKVFVISLFVTVLLSACSTSNQLPPSKIAPTVTTTQISPAQTATEISPTAIFTPAPTLSLPVGPLTPVPSSNSGISAENVQHLQEIAKYYGEIKYFAKLTADKRSLFILDPDGITKYDYQSMEAIMNFPLANVASDLQMSNDGNWLMIDNKWLLDLKNDKEPELYVLAEKIDLLNFYSRTFTLSPDGSMIGVEQVRCYDLCNHKLQIVSTDDFKVIYVSSGVSHQDLPAFSSDGKYFALVDLFIEAHADGSTNPAGASVSIWAMNDFTRVSSFSIEFPFYVTDIAFSEDNTLLAIAQTNSIDIIAIANGASKATITDLCESPQRKVMFAPTSPLRVLENSDCGAGVWLISETRAVLSLLYGYAPDFSKIVFDEKGHSKAIPYTQPANPGVRAYYQEDYFTFLNDDILSFKHPDSETLDSHSCDLSLASSSFDCQSHAPEYNSGRYLGKDVLLATDGKYYSYVIGKDKVDIYSFEDPSQVYYSIPFRDYAFDLLALDPINNLVIYNIALSMRANRVIIQDMTNDRILEKWEGETFLSSIAFSENKKFGALCRAIGYTSLPNKDRLVIFDLSEKRTVHNTEFTCGSIGFSFTNDGSKVAIAQYYSKVILLNTSLPFEKQNINIDASSNAVAFSPDGFMLAVGCNDSEICFLDPSDGKEIYRMKAHSGISNLAFSKDGSVLATSSDWGLISLWAVSPFTSNARQSQSSPISSYTPKFSWDFDEDGNFEGWGEQDWQVLGLKDIAVHNGYFSATATDSGTAIYTNEGLGIDASKLARIEIRMKVSSGEDAQLYFRHSNDDMSEELSKFFKVQPGTEFNTYILDMSNVSGWKGTVEQLRLDPIRDTVGATVEIDYIHLLPPGFSWNFDTAGNLEGWENWGEIDDVDVPNGYFYAKTIGADPQIYSSEGLRIDAAKFSQIEIRMRVSAGNSAQLFFRNENNDISENRSILFPIESGTEFKTYILDMGKITTWKNMIFQLRLDPTSDVNGATIEIDYIHLLP